MRITVLTILPEVFPRYLGSSILGRAQKKKLLAVRLVNIRDYAYDKHRTVDDRPYGGGPGMVMKVEPIYRALKAVRATKPYSRNTKKVVLLSARGRQFDQQAAKRLAKLKSLVLICGRYEGVDERVREKLADEELSIGPYVLSGGELAALVIVEAVARLVPGVLGNKESLREESHTSGSWRLARGALSGKIKPSAIRHVPYAPFLEYPHYTRPAVFSPRSGVRWRVPQVLLSGNHEKVRAWRTKEAQTLAKKRRWRGLDKPRGRVLR